MKKIVLGLILGLLFIVNSYCAEPIYTEQKVIDKIEILEDGQIQIRLATKVFKDGVEITKTYWRTVIAPDQDLSKTIIAPDATIQDIEKIKAVANVIWTKEVKDTYIAEKTKREIIK